jgi:hypothetical protein
MDSKFVQKVISDSAEPHTAYIPRSRTGTLRTESHSTKAAVVRGQAQTG